MFALGSPQLHLRLRREAEYAGPRVWKLSMLRIHCCALHCSLQAPSTTAECRRRMLWKRVFVPIGNLGLATPTKMCVWGSIACNAS